MIYVRFFFLFYIVILNIIINKVFVLSYILYLIKYDNNVKWMIEYKLKFNFFIVGKIKDIIFYYCFICIF